MIRTIFKSGNSLVVSLPVQLLDELQLKDGSEVDVAWASDGGSISVKPVDRVGITPDFAKKVDDLIEMYRPALQALSQR